MKIAILGPGCRNCVTLERLAREGAAELGIDADITKVTDYADIASYGIMSTPGLVLDGEVVLSGRLPDASEVRELIAAKAG